MQPKQYDCLIILGASSRIWRELRLEYDQQAKQLIELSHEDLTDDKLASILPENTGYFTGVFDFRSPPPSEISEANLSELIRSFSRGLHNLLKATSNGSTEYIRFGSGAVYGARESDYYPNETFATRPLNFYGSYHAACEEKIKAQLLTPLILRLPNVILADPAPHHFQAKILESARSTGCVQLNDSGKTVRNFVRTSALKIYIDRARAHLARNVDSRPTTFNVSGGMVLDSIGFTHLILKESGLHNVDVRPSINRPHEPFRVLTSVYEQK